LPEGLKLGFGPPEYTKIAPYMKSGVPTILAVLYVIGGLKMDEGIKKYDIKLPMTSNQPVSVIVIFQGRFSGKFLESFFAN